MKRADSRCVYRKGRCTITTYHTGIRSTNQRSSFDH